MPKKYYAVRKGRNPGIYENWEECKAQVNNFPGAEYKSFKTKPEARNYLTGNNKSTQTQNTTNPPPLSPDTATAYVDGSYDKETHRFSYGCIIFHKEEKTTHVKAYSDPTWATMRNVAGEIMGAIKAMKWCVKNNITTLNLYYDYEGIEKWCTGAWQAKNSQTKKYKEIYDEITTKNSLAVNFHKVKAHTGDTYNEEADKLAKQALKQ